MSSYEQDSNYNLNADLLIKEINSLNEKNFKKIIYNPVVPLNEILFTVKSKTEKRIKEALNKLKDDIEFIGLDYENEKKNIELLINKTIDYSKDLSGGTLIIDNDIISMNAYEQIKQQINDVDDYLIIKTVYSILPEILNVQKQKINGFESKPFDEYVYDCFLQNEEANSPLMKIITDFDKMSLFNEKEENVLFNSINQFIKENYINALLNINSVKELKDDDCKQSLPIYGLIVTRLLVKYGIIDSNDENNVIPEMPKNSFNNLSKMVLDDFLSDNIKQILKNYDASKMIDKKSIFTLKNELITESSMFETYKNDLEYITMRQRDFESEDYKSINEYLMKIVSTFFKYHRLVFNEELNNETKKLSDKIITYGSFINELWEQINEQTIERGWEESIIMNLNNLMNLKVNDKKEYDLPLILMKKKLITSFLDESLKEQLGAHTGAIITQEKINALKTVTNGLINENDFGLAANYFSKKMDEPNKLGIRKISESLLMQASKRAMEVKK
ncbi:MAG: hypothetical protein WC307_03705 [Candidatus Nanoarchaeia archaeon]|jgi:hypothetical protein